MAQTPSTEARAGLKLISPPALYAILMLAAPLATVLLYSVLTGEKGSVSLPLTLDNYHDLLTKPVYRALMWRSLIVSFFVTLATVILAYPIAYFVSFHVAPSRKALWLFLITIPFWTSYIIRVALWRTILGYDGIFDSVVMGLGITDTQPNILSNGVLSIIITLAHAYAPFAVLPIFVSLEKVDRSLLEAGQDLGESRWMTFLRVTLPLSLPGVIAAVLIVFIPTVGDYVTPELIGGGKTPMIANLMEVAMLKQRDQAMGSAIAVGAMTIVALISVAFVLWNKRYLGGRK
ncbi:ABC transporter permease [Tabrizicola soli]|uniref:ABC transporter permease n=1 Tax=Tabrizicola soli TaxID=2185115 RepID=A0ABV7DTT9_9RHOB|nr:ABC transporter permease [Tabrizicola soli]